MNNMQVPHPRMGHWLAVVKTYALCDRLLAQRLEPLGLSVPRSDVLLNVVRDPGIGQQELARRLLVARSNISMLITELERQELVERCPHPTDRRARQIFPTAKGGALAATAEAVLAEVVGLMLDQFTERDIAGCASMMADIQTALRRGLGEASDLAKGR
ncbi:MAG: MarR family winged helix-turn-helix transcriptional regulator [Pseudomonadota bacterium]